MIFKKTLYYTLSAFVLCTTVLVPLLLVATGCAPSRSQYYDGLHRRRERSYERWRENVEEDHAPHITGELSMDDALQLSFNHSPRLLASLQMQEEGRGRIIGAYSAALPDARLSGGYTRLDRRPQGMGLDPTTGQIEQVPVGDRDVYDAELELTQPLYQGGAIPVAQRAARLYAHLGDEIIRGAVEDTAFHVSNAYYRALLADELVKVQEAALESAERHLEVAKARREQGMARDYDVLRARVEVSNIEASLIEQRQEKDEAYSALWRGMGVSQKSEVKLTERLEHEHFETPTLEDAVAQAFRNRPDVYQATIEVDMSEEGVAETRTRYMPRLNAFYRYSQSRPDGSWDDQWRAGLRLNWSLFDGLAREGEMIRRRAELRRKEILLGDAEQQAIKEVNDALLDIESARELVRTQELNIERAAEAERLVEEGYREGVNTEIELLDARTAVAEARGLYYRALYRQKTAGLALQKATGELAPEP